MALYRVWQAPIETRAHRALVTTKLGDDSLLTLLDNEKAGTQPNQDGNRRNHTHACSGVSHVGLETTPIATTGAPARGATTRGATPFATHQLAQFAIEVTPNIVQIRRPCAGSGRLFGG
jgi:hypothetical protein